MMTPLFQPSAQFGGENLSKRIVVPVEDQKGLSARLAEHFGRAAYFAVVDLADDGEIIQIQTVENVGEHVGGIHQAHQNIAKLHPNAIIVSDMGPRGLQAFHNLGVDVMKANANTVIEVLAGYKAQKLEELIEGCPHARHG